MITPIIKTTFEEEQFKKDQAFLSLTGLERLDIARRVRERTATRHFDSSGAAGGAGVGKNPHRHPRQLRCHFSQNAVLQSQPQAT